MPGDDLTLALRELLHQVGQGFHAVLAFVEVGGVVVVEVGVENAEFEEVAEGQADGEVDDGGEVVARGPEVVNPRLATGEIEVVAREVAVQSAASELPMPVAGEADYPEDIGSDG